MLRADETYLRFDEDRVTGFLPALSISQPPSPF
jgi:hypothetical protein